jgi:2-oxoisovalerate dehydrogenase E1 component alpha subunit
MSFASELSVVRESESRFEVVSSQPAMKIIQFVTPSGQITSAGERHGIDVDLARSLYRDMYLARRFDREALALQRQGELGLWLQCWGQEAAQVGSIRALRADDYVFPSYREHAAALVRGVTPAQLLGQWRGVTHSGWDPQQTNFHFYSLVLGTQTLHATGYAMGMMLDGGDCLTATYFGDGSASQGDVNEALNWAAAGSLPVLFICQNNQWAISTPTSVQRRTPLYQRAAGFGLRSFHVDGNDVLAMHAVTAEAAQLVRSGEGPALIEAETFRMAGHSTSDDPGKYRDPAELDAWELKDPLTRLQRVLEALDTQPGFFTGLSEEAEDLARDVRTACHALEAPDMASLFDNVYTSPHGVMTDEKCTFETYTASQESWS